MKVNDPDAFDILMSNGADPISRGEEIFDIAILNNYKSFNFGYQSVLQVMLEKIEFSDQLKNRALVKSTELKISCSMEDLIDNGAKISGYNFIKQIIAKITKKNRHEKARKRIGKFSPLKNYPFTLERVTTLN
mgnify:FL=1